jgi:polar amino acid transport system substrate-binding protein
MNLLHRFIQFLVGTGQSLLALGILLIILAACGLSSSSGTEPTPIPDKLTEIMARETLIIATEPEWPPQSKLDESIARAENTKCGSDQFTANQFEGFDAAVAVEIAKRLGIEPCFVTPAWTLITSGNWDDRWDIHVGSMTIVPERIEALYFTQPYYTSPAAFFVHEDNTTFTKPADLSGKRIGVCTGCIYENYLDGTLTIPGEEPDFVVENSIVEGYQTEALENLLLGDGVELDAVLTQLTSGQDAIKAGQPIKQLGEPVFNEYLAIAVDKKHSKNPISLARKAAEIVRQMHDDGTLQQLSQQYYGLDLTTAASQFDIQSVQQLP